MLGSARNVTSRSARRAARSTGLARKSNAGAAQRVASRSYNFASEAYAGCFGNLERADSAKLRVQAVECIEKHEPSEWHNDPVQTYINGQVVTDANCAEVMTTDAFGNENGKMVHGSDAVCDQVIAHMHNYKPPVTDLRAVIRKVEQELLTTYAPQLIADQSQDFWKQDGITEIEESTEANTVERRLNDLVWEDEQRGAIKIGREPALIGCVSNFSIFLDLFRKTIRNLELGVPCVVLSRSNTGQHTFRWFKILQALLAEAGVDPGMLSHASCGVEGQRKIIAANPRSPLYFTGSRQVAQAIKEICPNLMASTGGPNTMVAEEWTDPVGEAVMLSASIENAGQCTALRHVVAPANAEHLEKAFDSMPVHPSPKEALGGSAFAGIFQARADKVNVEAGYKKHPSQAMVYKVNEGGSLPSDEIDEHWREVYVDMTSVNEQALQDDAFKNKLARWLNTQQPISLAVNGKNFDSAFPLADYMFTRTGMVVNTVGSSDKPALTAQARPQDAEIFGEFPPRDQLTKNTRFPVVGPSSTPGYNAHYTDSYLESQRSKGVPAQFAYCNTLLDKCTPRVQGYLVTLLEYLAEAANGPRSSYGSVRTALWGLQRPPLGSNTSVLRAGADTSADALAIYLLPYFATNAHDAISVSLAPGSPAKALAEAAGVPVVEEDDAAFRSRCAQEKPWNVVEAHSGETAELSLVGHHVSLLFPLGHIKSVRPGDGAFTAYFIESAKWLRARSN